MKQDCGEQKSGYYGTATLTNLRENLSPNDARLVSLRGHLGFWCARKSHLKDTHWHALAIGLRNIHPSFQ